MKFSNDHSLTPAQIKLFANWLAAGRPGGDPAETAPPPEFHEDWQIGKPDQIATMTGFLSVPVEGRDVYRNFVIPLNPDQDTWVEAVEFLPGAPEVDHHILYFLDTAGKAPGYDSEDKRPGFNMSKSNADFHCIGGWDVDTQPTELPHGLRWFISKSADLVVQIHYHPNGKEITDQSSIGFHFSDTREQKEATHEALRIFLVNQFIDRLWEGNFTALGGKNAALVEGQKKLKLLDFNRDSKLSPGERALAIPAIRNSDFMKKIGPIGCD